MKNINIGFAQIHPVWKKNDKNFEKILSIIKKYDFDILVFPELSFSGYNFKTKNKIKKYALKKDNDYFKEIIKICKKDKKNVVIGFAENSNNKIYNSSAFITQYSDIHIYRKTHLFYKEKDVFTKGNTGFFITEINKIKYGQMICFDWFFPESIRTLALKGADVILHPANLVMPYCQNAMKTFSLVNRVFVVTANRIGKEREFLFTGRSQIVSPYGEVLKRGYEKRECVRIIKINPKLSRNKNINSINNIFKDRRKDFYV